MGAEKVPGRFVHRLEIQGPAMPQARRRKPGTRNRALEDGIDVQPRSGGEAGGEVTCGAAAAGKRDGRAEHPVERVPELVEVLGLRSIRHVDYLAEGMHARIGASRTGRVQLPVEQSCEGPVDVALDGADLFLARETSEGRSVVGEI